MSGNSFPVPSPLESQEIRDRLSKLRPNSGLVRVTQKQGLSAPDTFEGKFIGFNNIGVEVFSIMIEGEGEATFAVNRHAGIINIEILRPF